MSIDQRLRTGLRTETTPAPDLTDLLDGWADVEARAEQQRVRDRARWVAGIAAAAVLVVVVAVTWWPGGDEDVQPIQPAPSPTASTTETPTPPSPIEGTWSTGPVPAQGVLDHLASVGLGQWGEAVLQSTPAGATIEYRIKLQGGRVNLTKAVDGGLPADQDLEAYEISGTQVSFTPIGSDCSAVFEWEVQGDRLRLALASDDCPDYRGTPDAALMHGLYGAFPFTRTGS